jgi:hypothetical protein
MWNDAEYTCFGCLAGAGAPQATKVPKAKKKAVKKAKFIAKKN